MAVAVTTAKRRAFRYAPVMTDRLHQNNSAHGIMFMLLGMLLLNTMDAIAKWLVEHSVHTMQILALRSVLIVPVIVLVFILRGRLAELKPTRPVAQALRGLIGTIAPMAFFMGIGRIPLTNSVVVFFSAIFMTTLLSVVFLKEKVGLHRWVAVAVGYCGVMIAIAPESGGDLTGYLLILLSSFMYSLLFISGRVLSATESVSSLVLSFNAGVGIVSLLLLPWFWFPLTTENWLFIVLLASFAVCGHFCLTYAFSVAEASLISPFEYTAVVWTLLFDRLIWSVTPGARTWVGAVIIIASGLYVIYREHRQTNVSVPKL